MNEEKRDLTRVVLDTNVLLSALLWHQGKPRLIFRKVIEGSLRIFCCKEIIDELSEILERDFEEPIELIDQQISVVLAYVEIVELSYFEKIVTDDPDDDIIMNCALSANADFVVSGDSHLQKLKKFKGINIVSPTEFLRIFEEY